MPSGPTHRANNAESVWARNSCPGVAAKSRVIRMTGSLGSASMTVSVILFIFVSSHLRQDGVEAAVTLLDAAPVALDPGIHQVIHPSTLVSPRRAHRMHFLPVRQ